MLLICLRLSFILQISGAAAATTVLFKEIVILWRTNIFAKCFHVIKTRSKLLIFDCNTSSHNSEVEKYMPLIDGNQIESSKKGQAFDDF